MLTQSHVRVLPDFYGLTTSFRRVRLKPGMIVLAEGVRTPEEWAALKELGADGGTGPGIESN